MSESSQKIPVPEIELPTIGRVVHIFFTNPLSKQQEKPMAAIVADVVDKLTINAMVIRHGGAQEAVAGVPHKTQYNGELICWDWMAYQKGQARKTREAEEAADQLRKAMGAGAQGGVYAKEQAARHSDEIGKTQASVPSPLDGKR